MSRPLRPVFPLLAPLALLLLLLLFGGCQKGGCNKKSQTPLPQTKNATIEALAASLPADVDFAVFLPELDTALNAIAGNSDPSVKSFVDRARPDMLARVGFDPLDSKTYEQLGIRTRPGVALASVGEQIALVGWLQDASKWEQILNASPWMALRKGIPIKELKEGEKTLFLQEGAEKGSIGWFLDGNRFTIVLEPVAIDHSASPPTSNEPQSSVQDLLRTCSQLQSGSPNSLQGAAGGEPFKRFLAHIPETSLLSAYFQWKGSQSLLPSMVDPALQKTLGGVHDSSLFVGMGVSLKGRRLEVPLYVDSTDQQNAIQLLSLFKNASILTHTAYASDDLMLAVRLSIDPLKAWDLYLAGLSEDEREAFNTKVTFASEDYELDLKKTFIEQLSGDMILAFYGLTGNPLSMMSGNVGAISRALSLVLLASFKDDSAPKALLDYARFPEINPMKPDTSPPTEAAKPPANPTGADITDAIRLTPRQELNLRVIDIEHDTVKRLTSSRLPFNLFINSNNLLLSTLAVPPVQAVGIIKNVDSPSMIANHTDLDLTSAFVSKPVENGIVLNVKRLRDNLGSFVGLLNNSTLSAIVDGVEELTFTTEPVETGILNHLVLDLSPQL